MFRSLGILLVCSVVAVPVAQAQQRKQSAPAQQQSGDRRDQVVETAKPAETPSDSLPLRELFLALCGSLTAASALRFVLGA